MIFLILLYFVLTLSSSICVSGLRIPVRRMAFKGFVTESKIGNFLASAGNTSDDVSNIGNIRYTTSIHINGRDVHVVLDTGSTDLWVIPPGGIGQFNDTGVGLSLLYGDGTYGVSGTIGVAPFEFGPYKIEQQAFLLANESTIGALTDLGIYGLFGLGFNDPQTSPINAAIFERFGATATWGASVLENIFNQHSSDPNLIGVDLARTEDLEGTAGGSFNIGDYDEEYAAVASAPKLSQYPPGSGRWTTLLDGVMVDGYSINIESTITGVPPGKIVALVDTGSPTGVFSLEIMMGIFSRVPGAAFDPVSQYWIVPCNATSNVELIFADQTFPIHPLDLTTISTAMISGTNYTVCIGSFSVQDRVGGNEFDVVLGDTFLRNVYTVYDFGDPSGTTPPNDSITSNSSDASAAAESFGTPFIQFLAQTDPFEAAKQHITARTKALSHLGPELPPIEFIKLLNSDSGLPSSTSVTTADSASTSVKSSVNLAGTGDEPNSTDSAVSRYAPIVIGLLGANLLIGVVLVVFGILGCVRKGVSGTKSGSSHYVPVKVKDDDGLYRTPGYTPP